MRVYGSILNRIQEACRQPAPEVGMGATHMMYSDRQPYTVIRVLSPTRILVQADRAIRADTNGQSESQTYDYQPDPQGVVLVLSRRRNGRWIPAGLTMYQGSFCLGIREAYRDPSF